MLRNRGIFLALALSFAGLAAAHAQDVTLPRAVLSAQGQRSYPAALASAKAAIDAASMSPKAPVLMGYRIEPQSEGQTKVTLKIGMPTDVWPTQVVEIGTISVLITPFPDGVEGYMQTGAAQFEPATSRR